MNEKHFMLEFLIEAKNLLNEAELDYLASDVVTLAMYLNEDLERWKLQNEYTDDIPEDNSNDNENDNGSFN